MIKLILIYVTFLTLLLSCSSDKPTAPKEEPYLSYGKVTGQDFRMCACCGGWLITIDNLPHRFYSLPDSTGFKLDTCKLPVFIDLDWQKPEKPCMNDLITVTRARLRKM